MWKVLPVILTSYHVGQFLAKVDTAVLQEIGQTLNITQSQGSITAGKMMDGENLENISR